MMKLESNTKVRERGAGRNKRQSHGPVDHPSKDQDAVQLAMLGKKQQLNRNFGYLSVIAFSSTLIATWECVASTLNSGLVNGGPSVLVYGYLLCFFGTLAASASLAEMTSIAPVSGGQYHWVYMFAPRRYASIMSWIAGWIITCGWVSGSASCMFLAGTQIQGLLVLNYDSYVFQRWHGTMIYWAIMVLAASVNTLGIRILPHIESLALILHISFWIILLVPMVYLAPQSSNSFVFATKINAGGWDSDGISWCIGVMTTVFSLAGFDGACHMSEEVSNAASVVPKSLVMTIWINGSLGFGMVIALLYSIGDVNSVLQTATGYPFIQIFFNATGSLSATTALTCLVVINLIFASFGQFATASRVIWAFARDNGLPFSSYFAHVDKQYSIPIRAVALLTCLNTVWGLINIGSSTAFNAIASVAVSALYFSYAFAIALFLRKKLNKETINYGPWVLGRWGVPINVFALVFAGFISVVSLFPAYQPVTALNMNYAPVVCGIVLCIAAVAWVVYGKEKYRGPIQEVTFLDRGLSDTSGSH